MCSSFVRTKSNEFVAGRGENNIFYSKILSGQKKTLYSPSETYAQHRATVIDEV